MTADHLLGPICSFKINFAKIVIKKGVTKNKAVAVTNLQLVRLGMNEGLLGGELR